LPAVQKVREAASRSQCTNNLKQIGLAIHSFHQARQELPPSRIADHYATWAVLILPHLEQDNVYNQWDLRQSYYLQSPTVQTAQVKTYYCPTRRSPPQLVTSLDVPSPIYTGEVNRNYSGALADYACSSGDRTSYTGELDDRTANGAIIIADSTIATNRMVTTWRSRTTLQSLTDGTSNTILVGEKHVPITMQGKGGDDGDGCIYNGDHHRNFGRVGGPAFPLAQSPTDLHEWQRSFGSYHPGLCQFVFGDGSVHALPVSINPTTLRLLIVRNDGRPIPDF
jgi:hypothetical protein